jgi:hypothetical protein
MKKTDNQNMAVYFEDDWFEDAELNPAEQKTINELRSALLNRDFAQASKTLQKSTAVKNSK